MTQHTQGRWHTGADGIIVYDKDNYGVACATAYPTYHIRYKAGEARANARRIVACVNACAAFEDEELQYLSVAGQFGHGVIANLRDQRDALLVALELAKDVLDNVQGDINPERGYAVDLEADVSSARVAVTAAIVAAKLGPTVSVPAELVGGV